MEVDIVNLSIGFFLGVLASFIVGYWFFLRQFLSSLAGFRVNDTVKATKQIPKSKDRTAARNRYRNSLGVIIDTLDQTWNSNKFKEDEWPPLVHFSLEKIERGEADSEADRWALFNEYVKPVMESINSYAFLGRQYLNIAFFFRKESEIRKLTALTELCNQLEAVVSKFDAAYGSNLVEMSKVNDKVVIQPVSGAKPENTKRLREAYRELHKAWVEWLRVVNLA